MPRLRANYKFTVFHTYHPFFSAEVANSGTSLSAIQTDPVTALQSIESGKVSENENKVSVAESVTSPRELFNMSSMRSHPDLSDW
jgi:hypothetical protein